GSLAQCRPLFRGRSFWQGPAICPAARRPYRLLRRGERGAEFEHGHCARRGSPTALVVPLVPRRIVFDGAAVIRPTSTLTFPMIETATILAASESAPPRLASQLRRLVFVGGSPRSGTTLVQRILNCHPEIYGGPEFDFVPPIADLFQLMRKSISSGRIDAILDEPGLVHAFRSLLVALLLPKLQAEGVSFLSEKTPSNVLPFAWLEDCVPEAKKILVVRDPRDVVYSMVEVGRRQRLRRGHASGFVRDTVAAVNYMNRCLTAGAALAEISDNCLVIHYEDVVSEPLAV